MFPAPHGPPARPLSAAERFFARAAEAILARRWLSLGAVFLLTAILGAGIPKIRLDNSNEAWFAPNDPTVSRYEDLKRTFGSDTFIYFLLEVENVFTPEVLQTLEQITGELESMSYRGEPIFREIIHLGNVRYLRGDAASIEVIGLTEDLPEGSAGMNTWRTRAFELPTYENLLVNRAGNATGIVATMNLHPGDGDYHSVVTDVLRQKLKEPPFASLTVTAAGGPLLDADMDRVTASEGITFGALAIAINLLAMAWLFKRWAGVVIPVAVMVMTLVCTFGLLGHSGVTVNVVVIILPALLTSVSVSDSVHVMSEYQTVRAQGRNRHDAIVFTVAQVGLAALLTSTTTAAGMLSLVFAPMPPIQTLGLSSAFGVALAFVISLLFVPAALSLTDLPLPKRVRSHTTSDRILRGIATFSITRTKAVLAVSAVLMALSFWGASRVEIETNFVQSFKKSFSTRQDFDRIERVLGATSSLQFVIDTGREGGVKEPDFLRRLSALQEWIEKNNDSVVKTLSVADLVKNLNYVTMDGEREAYAIPNTRAAVAQELLLYESANPDSLFEIVTDDYRTTRLDIRSTNKGTRAAMAMMRATEAEARALLGPDVTFHFTGISQLFVNLSESLAQGQIYSYIAAFAVIMFMMVALLKSLRLGAWSMIPNLLPVLFTLGVMGLFNIPLDFITLLIACVAIGIAVDDTIHFLVRFSKELAYRGDYAEAITHSLVSVGRAMTFTTTILVLGLLVFLPSVSLSVSLFGGLVALTIAVAWFADVLLMPALLVVTKPLRIEPAPLDDINERPLTKAAS